MTEIDQMISERQNGEGALRVSLLLQSKRKLVFANLLLYASNTVLRRSIFIPVHEEWSGGFTSVGTPVIIKKTNFQRDTKQRN